MYKREFTACFTSVLTNTSSIYTTTMEAVALYCSSCIVVYVNVDTGANLANNFQRCQEIDDATDLPHLNAAYFFVLVVCMLGMLYVLWYARCRVRLSEQVGTFLV